MVLSPVAESALVDEHTPLVRHLARRYLGHGIPQDDLIQEGLIGLIEAVRTFNPEKRMKLGSWIALLASQAMLDAVRAADRRRPTQRLSDRANLVVDEARDRADDGDIWDALDLVRQDLGQREARLFWAWLGFGSQQPLVLLSLCKRFRVDMPRVLTVIGLGLRSCHDRLGLERESSCLN